MTSGNTMLVFMERDLIQMIGDDIPGIPVGTDGEITIVCGGGMYYASFAALDKNAYVYGTEIELIERPEYRHGLGERGK